MRVVIVDDDRDVLDRLRGDLESCGLEVVGEARDGDEGLREIEANNPDVVITDIVMPKSDGYILLEGLLSKGYKGRVVVLSALARDAFIIKAIDCGAEQYILKPYSKDMLIERVLGDVVDKKPEIKVAETISAMGRIRGARRGIDERISNIFITVGIPAHIKGYQFLREAIKLTIDTPDIINSITKRLYPQIAIKYTTSSSKVERAIRHAIEVAWNRGRIENINTLFGVKVYTQNDRPTNGEFIALVADKMLLESM